MIEKLKIIIGTAVLDSGSDDTINLSKLVNYWYIQLEMMQKEADPELKEWIADVISKGESFLK